MTPSPDLSSVKANAEIAIIRRIAEVSSAAGWRACAPAQDIAGMIVSFLAANPEHVESFMREGGELFIDGTIRPEHGCLSYRKAR
jgi:hypothetical protein